ncbi:unannotated protein [freshwater metagenome]|jgi:hypothetical protein|uniref:Unannotated protein n=1 Tax=freshwater metagenome TaxID=449393 RepID=A0A6J6VNY1_9ZZZZ|nr:hypothetical protein [Actinomycetota bacterium]
MNTFKDRRVSSVFREALGQVWDLHVKAIPTAMIWAISLMFIFQSPSLLIKLICSIICSVISLINAAMVNFSTPRVTLRKLVKTSEFQRILLLNILLGILFVIALNNAINMIPTPMWLSLIIMSIVPSLLMLWMGMMIVFNPIFIMNTATESSKTASEMFFYYLKSEKRVIALTFFIILALAPLIFLFICIALTLSQALTVRNFQELNSTFTSKVDIHNG